MYIPHIYTVKMHCSMLIQILGLYLFSITYLEAGGEEMTTWSTEVIQIFWLPITFPGSLNWAHEAHSKWQTTSPKVTHLH
jgi:hypothetical protein